MKPFRRLFLSRIESDFDPARDIAAGPWCFVGNEENFEHWEDIKFTDAFARSENLIEADIQTRQLANHIALSWADRMNAQTDRNYSPVMWRNFLILWIVAATQTTWRCYRNIELLIARHADEPIQVEVLEESPDWQIQTMSDFMKLLTLNDDFNKWMSSLIVRQLAPENWTLSSSGLENSNTINSPNGASELSIHQNRNPLRAFIGRLGFDHVQGTKFIRPFFGLLIKFLPRHAATGKKFEANPAILDHFPKPYLAVLDKFLEMTLPLDFSTHLKAHLESVECLKFHPGRLTITHAASVDIRNQLINVLSVEHGERVVGFQHGGWYGTAMAEAWSSESEYIYHAFITWGWTEQADYYGNMMPLPAPVLSHIRNAHHPRNDNLIFVGTRMVVQNDRFDSRPSSVRWLAYRKLKRQFINSLGNTTRASLKYCPYHRATPLLQDGDYMTRHFPNLPILEEPLHDAFQKCRLVILDHPGTTLNFIMAANTPTVCYWDPNDWPMCKQAEEYFMLLREAKILFDNPEDAAEHINEIWNDVPNWWESPNVQKARTMWQCQYALTSPIWWWHWAVGIWRLATGRQPKYGKNQLANSTLHLSGTQT